MSPRLLLHHFRQIDAWLVGPALLIVIFGELTHLPLAQDLDVEIWDKAMHFTGYCILAVMTTIAVRADRRALWCAMGLIFMGGILEIVQGYTGRDAELLDEAANTLGVTTGLICTWVGIAVLKARQIVDPTPP